MFKILGADGKEYGFVSVDQIIRWISEGRANHETMALREGEPSWKPLAQYLEFASALGIQPPTATPPPLAAASANAGEPASDARTRAVQMAGPPAIGLMITGGLGTATNTLSIIIQLVRTAPPPPSPELPPEIAHMFEILNGPVGIFAAVFGLAVSLFVLYGALQMQKLSNRALALAAAIVAMVPCFSPCCVIGLPIGIWALVVLAKPEVSSQFDR